MAVLAEPGLVNRFTAALKDLRAEPHAVPIEGRTAEVLRSIVDGHHATRVVVANLPRELGPPVKQSLAGLDVRFLDDTAPEEVVAACASADVGVTWAEFGVADEGAIIEIALDETARFAASLPIVHVVLLPTGRIFRDVGEAMSVVGEILRSSEPGRRPTITFISGPSRTGDIELRLLYGVHGPHSLHVMLLDWFERR